jgi:threonine dehydrogenase-like Zn-dependent dehydrogenase
MITHGRVDLGAMVTPRLPWEKAPQAFDMYANPDRSEDSLKITLVF